MKSAILVCIVILSTANGDLPQSEKQVYKVGSSLQRDPWDDGYPFNKLKCYSSLTRPDTLLICPQGRNSFCVKEVTSLKQDLCGKTQYFGDTYANEECAYKKCAHKCVEEQIEFQYGGQSYTRKRFCCNDKNYCNSSIKSIYPTFICYLLFIVLSLYLFIS